MVRVAVVQMSSQQELDPNLAQLGQLVGEAGQRGAELVLLPENFAYMGPEPGRREVADELDAGDGPVVSALRTLACRHGVWLVAGGLPERSGDPDRPYNTCAAFAPDGTLCGRYRKIHLFDVELNDGADYRESTVTTAGDEPVVLELAGLKVGLSVCYDLRFPELYRRLAALGAELLVVPAAFTLATGKDHWHVLLRARAIENQAYVLAAGQWGQHGQRLTYGKSCIIDPWGEIVAQASEGVGVAVADVDLGLLAAVRARLPALRHRRLPV
jgi:predicted amidohydrolase